MILSAEKVLLCLVDNLVEHWHEGDNKASLPSFLGMSPEMYREWVFNPVGWVQQYGDLWFENHYPDYV